MKNKLIISIILCLSTISCWAKTPKNPTISRESDESPLFIRFDNTQEILNWRLQGEDTNVLEDAIRHNEKVYKEFVKYIRESTQGIDYCEKWIAYHSSNWILFYLYPKLEGEINKAKQDRAEMLKLRSVALLQTIKHCKKIYKVSPIQRHDFSFIYPQQAIKNVSLKTALENYSQPIAVVLRE